MMMTPATARKIEALKALVKNGDETNHYVYAELYAKHKGVIPSWTTLKKHNVLTFNRTGLTIVKGYNGGLEATNVNYYNYNL